MKIKPIYKIILAFLLGAGITATSLYVLVISPQQEGLADMKIEADDSVVRNCGFDISLAVSIRESSPEKTADFLDQKILPSTIRVLDDFAHRSDGLSFGSPYYLWRLKKYSKDFSIKFPKNEMDILDKVPDKRPVFSGKIGNE